VKKHWAAFRLIHPQFVGHSPVRQKEGRNNVRLVLMKQANHIPAFELNNPSFAWPVILVSDFVDAERIKPSGKAHCKLPLNES